MSFVVDNVHRIDGEVDRLYEPAPDQASREEGGRAVEEVYNATSGNEDLPNPRIDLSESEFSPRIIELQAIARAVSTASSAKKILSPSGLLTLLQKATSAETQIAGSSEKDRHRKTVEIELLWVVIAKITAQAYGITQQILLEHTTRISDDINYWSQVHSSYRYTALYSAQTSPLRAWDFCQKVYIDTQEQLRSLSGSQARIESTDAPTEPDTISARWRFYYDLVSRSLRQHAIPSIRKRAHAPFSTSRRQAKDNEAKLARLRQFIATELGILVDEGLQFGIAISGTSDSLDAQRTAKVDKPEVFWKTTVEDSVGLLGSVLKQTGDLDISMKEFENSILNEIDIQSHTEASDTRQGPREQRVCSTLEDILKTQIAFRQKSFTLFKQQYGRPSWIIRNWLPATALFLSSSTILRILLNRKAEVVTWIREVGQTVVDFWVNWVVEPGRKLVATIRHDEQSEVAIQSKRSLQGDQASLERMVVDFAVDNATSTSGGRLSDTEIADVRAQVKDGDLTAVLKAYEKDLQKPFMGAVRGDLIRGLLIQIQKTKVDVEVAIGGIDAILKSQELVFGFIGLTPGLLVSIFVGRWLTGLFGGRKGLAKQQEKSHMLERLASIDRILGPFSASGSDNAIISFAAHGLLIYEAQGLQKSALRVLPKNVHAQFLDELKRILDSQSGSRNQLRTVKRIYRSYWKWLA